MTQEEELALISRWEKVWPPPHGGARVWYLQLRRSPSGRIRIRASATEVVDVRLSPFMARLERESSQGVTGILHLFFDTREVHSIRAAKKELEGDYQQFAAEYLQTFRRDCWLAGFPVEATATEKAEWIIHGRSLGLNDGEMSTT